MTKEVNKKLRHARQAAGLLQREVAKAIDVNVISIYRWETKGQRIPYRKAIALYGLLHGYGLTMKDMGFFVEMQG